MSKNNCILVFLLFSGMLLNCCYAQEKGFLTTYSEEDHSWRVTDAVETQNREFIICAFDEWGSSSMLLKLSAEGEVLAKTTIAAEDTTVYANRLLQVPNECSREYVVMELH